MKRMVESGDTSIKIGHALGAGSEMKTIADELRALAAQTSIPTPATDRLSEYLEPSSEPVAEGSAELPLDWRGVWIPGFALVALAIIISMLSAGAR